ncbi:MAG TPA: hypothetical protein PKN96_11565, partial [Flavobacterium sp.]|uniref:hypothetical protein n=1 Tax=Flavobacterium sp. TaxID=239 RepID=UPI002CDFFD62
LKNNIANISFDIANISKHLDDKNKDKSDLQNLSRNPKNPDNPFCALADVPDIVWKQIKTDKAPWGRKGHENPNHYADVDAPTKDGSKNLFAKCKIPTDLTTETLMDYYKNIDNEKTGIANVERITEELKKEREERTGIKPIASDPVHHYGLIFFRVWQIYNYMVKALKEEKDVAKFLFAAGVSAHYWGDACQPLHSSYMSDGNPKDAFKDKYTAKKDSPKTSKDPHKKGDVYSILTNPGKGVHVAFEDKMIDKYIDEKILPGLRTILEDINSSINKVTIESMLSGQEAGFALLKLMEKTQEKLPPITIVEAYKKAKEEKIDVPTALYEQFGDKTVECLALGSRYLTAFWEAAWKAGSGSTNITSLEKVNEKALIDLYSVTTELPSMYLNDVDTVLDDNKSVTTKKSSTAKSGKKTKT